MAIVLDSTEWFPLNQNGVGNWAPLTGTAVVITSANAYSYQVADPVSLQLTAIGTPTPQWRTVATQPGDVVGTAGLPAGITINAAGLVSGTITASVGQYTITVEAYNSQSSATQRIVFTVVGEGTGVPPVIVSADGGNVLLNQSMSRQFIATGSPAPTWSITAGAAPPGVTLDSATGLLSGAPTSVGGYSFTVTATNPHGSDSIVSSLSVQQAPQILVSAPIEVPYGQLFTMSIPAVGYPALTWDVSGGTVPPGLSLTSNGVLTGSSTSPGTYNVFVTAYNTVTSTTQQIMIIVASPGGPQPDQQIPGMLIIF